jgi:hypothetical protein
MYLPSFAMTNNHMWDTIKIKNDKCKLLRVVSFFPNGDTLGFCSSSWLTICQSFHPMVKKGCIGVKINPPPNPVDQ